MTREEFMNKLQECYFGNKTAFNEIVEYFDTLQIHCRTAENTAEKLQKKLEEKDGVLQMIRDVGFDYDGFNDVDNLKVLINDLREIAHKGIKGEPILERTDK